MKKAFLIHGWGGSPEEGWRPWLKEKLEKKGFEVYIPSMPDTNHPKMDAWLKRLSDTVGIPDRDCYFVGHSLGCITILRYLERLKENQKIKGVVLVAGFSDIKITVGKDETTDEISTFFKTKLDFEKIKKHCDRFIAIHSDNDPYVPIKYATIFKEKLNAEIVINKNMKHFSGDEGVKELPAILEAMDKLCQQ